MEVALGNLFSVRSAWLRLALLLLSFGWCDLAHAQSTASLNGTVTDPAGAAVPRAKVSTTNQATGVVSDTLTDGAGAYLFPALPIGTYRLEVRASGFQTAAISSLKLDVATSVTENVELKVGDATTLPYDESSFDKVFCVNVIYFWKNPEQQLREIFRVLRQGGTLAIYMGDSTEMAGVRITQTGVFNLYPAKDVMRILKEVGFSSQEYATSAISQGPLSQGVCVLAEK